MNEEVNKKDSSAYVLYEQLQAEYNKLLKKHAAAENTIDELRTGTSLHLYSEPIQSNPNGALGLEETKYTQAFNYSRPMQANTSDYFTMNETCTTNFSSTAGGPWTLQSKRDATSEFRALASRVKALNEDVNTVESLSCVDEANERETLNDLRNVCSQLRNEHSKLKCDLKLLSRNSMSYELHSSSDGKMVSTKSELNKELSRIILHIDEIEEDVTGRLDALKSLCFSGRCSSENELKSHVDKEDLASKIRNFDTTVSHADRLPRRKSSSTTIDSLYFTSSPRRNRSENGSRDREDELDDSQHHKLNVTWPQSRQPLHNNLVTSRYSFSETPQHRDCNKKDMVPVLSHDISYVDKTCKNNNAVDVGTCEKEESRLRSTDEETLDDETTSPLGEKSLYNSEIDHLPSHGDEEKQTTSSLYNEYYTKDNISPSCHESSQSKPASGEATEKSLSDIKDNVASRHATKDRLNFDDRKGNARKVVLDEEDGKNLKFHRQKQHISSLDHQTRNLNSLSSLGDSSRLSTPLFQPRGTTRMSPRVARGYHASKCNYGNQNDGFDSGFVGSDVSRNSRQFTGRLEHSPSKINLTSQWDSNYHLDLVTEDEEETEQMSPLKLSSSNDRTANLHCHSSMTNLTVEQPNDDVLRIQNERPLSSTEKTPVCSSRYKMTSSNINRRYLDRRRKPTSFSSSDNDSSVEETTKVFRHSRRQADIKLGPAPMPDRLPTDTDKSTRNDELSLKYIDDIERQQRNFQNELNSLHKRVNIMSSSRESSRMYDRLRDHHERLRKMDERKQDRKLDDLRQAIENLKIDVLSSRKKDNFTTLNENFRRELQNISDKLDQLTSLGITPDRSHISTGINSSPQETVEEKQSVRDDDMAMRLRNLVRKVDELRSRVDDQDEKLVFQHKNYRDFCRYCDNEYSDINVHQGASTVNTVDHLNPRTSTPFSKHSRKLDQRTYLSRSYPGATPRQSSPLVHHIHTYHGHSRFGEFYETSDDEDLIKRKRSSRRKRKVKHHQSRFNQSYNHHPYLDEACNAAWDVQRLSKNILNTISFDLTSLRT